MAILCTAGIFVKRVKENAVNYVAGREGLLEATHHSVMRVGCHYNGDTLCANA